ncbi:hypothetical protein [Sphingomonas psychrolutea]|uniref:Major facilitator superfamily (MFS) profile domain-containing protein n=1 Tax=Sphingomonas psychrolutea TaxID=1259676 RepID=A0ABQ1G2J2_9SPHN|nr:hypothetical protein [Sphingomonas psychrolutea]GGA35614.1 hypothetical protein GCM10011395_02460 [Sphingomonas psychrolutea]
MTDPDVHVRNRYFAIVAARIGGSAGALLGLVLIARADATVPKVIGTALVLSALLMIAILPRALARRWRTPPGDE